LQVVAWPRDRQRSTRRWRRCPGAHGGWATTRDGASTHAGASATVIVEGSPVLPKWVRLGRQE
jgi:hypothetical protein